MSDISNPALGLPHADPLYDRSRVRVSQFRKLLSVSKSTYYSGVKSGRYPKPDGYDGKMPYYYPPTIRAFL